MKIVKGNVKSVIMRITQDFNADLFQQESKANLFSVVLIPSFRTFCHMYHYLMIRLHILLLFCQISDTLFRSFTEI